VGRRGAHFFTILGVLIAFIGSADGAEPGGRRRALQCHRLRVDGAGKLVMEVGFLIDGLTAMMMVVVTFVSLMVHVYTIGYMEGDPGYQRFFSYISLFTFSMLMLVMSNNFLQLFFGWEAVGLVSYLLIGFWFKKPTAIFANMKAFLVNRVGDFGFILGIGLMAAYGFAELHRDLRQGARAGQAGLSVPDVGRRLDADHGGLHLPVHRRHGQERAVSAARLAARFDGRPDAHLRADPRGHDGDGRHLHGGAHVAAVRASDTALNFVLVIGCDHGAVHGLPGHHPERHQACGGLFHLVAAGLHDGGAGCFGLQRGGLPPDDARLLQGAALPGRGQRDHRHAPRPGHPQHGRPAQAHAR
jgi:hypothetical protein